MLENLPERVNSNARLVHRGRHLDTQFLIHDLLAMLKFRTLRIEGDPYPFMSNLLYFKDVMASLRRSAS